MVRNRVETRAVLAGRGTRYCQGGLTPSVRYATILHRLGVSIVKFDWDTFPGRGRNFVARASLRGGSGQIGFSNGAVSRYGLEKYDGVILHYDKGRAVIGVELVKDSVDPRVLKLVNREGDSYISAKSFIQWSQIPLTPETQRFELWRDDQSGYLIIELGKPILKRDKAAV